MITTRTTAACGQCNLNVRRSVLAIRPADDVSQNYFCRKSEAVVICEAEPSRQNRIPAYVERSFRSWFGLWNTVPIRVLPARSQRVGYGLPRKHPNYWIISLQKYEKCPQWAVNFLRTRKNWKLKWNDDHDWMKILARHKKPIDDQMRRLSLHAWTGHTSRYYWESRKFWI
jgi:hypothetical protein